MAKRQNAVYALRQYLDYHGERHADEIKRDLLPEKEIAEAVKTRSVLTLLEIAKRMEGTLWVEAAKTAVHGIHREELSRHSKAFDKGYSARPILVGLLSHAERVMDPHVRFLVRLSPLNRLSDTDAELSRKYGGKYHRAAPFLSVSELRFARGEVEDQITKQMRELVGEALALVPEQDEVGQKAGGHSADWSTIEVGLVPIVNENHFITKLGEEVFCDVRLFLTMYATQPGTNSTETLSFTSERADFNPDSYSVLAKLINSTKPGDEYKDMIKKAPASLAQQLADAFTLRRY